MKQLFCQSGKPKIIEVPTPEQRPGFAVVQTMFSFVSTGTERSTIENQARPLLERFLTSFNQNTKKLIGSIQNEGVTRTLDKILAMDHKHLTVGYALSGKVVWACPSTGLLPGDLVVCAGSQFANHAQFVLAPKNLISKVNDKSKLLQASAGPVLAIAINAFFKSKAGLGSVVLIIGLGTIGSMLAQVASSAGCTVFVFEKDPQKRARATVLGVTRAFDPDDNGATKAIELATSASAGMSGVDAVFITTSQTSPEVFQCAMDNVRAQGCVILVSGGQVNFDRETFYKKEAQLIAACSYGPGRYNYNYEVDGVEFPVEFVRWTENRILALAIDLIEKGRINIDFIIDQELEFTNNNFEQSYTQALQSNALGIIIKYSSDNAFYQPKTTTDNFVGAPMQYLQKPFKTAIVGAGSFCQSTIIPILKTLHSTKIYAVVDQDIKTSLSVGQMTQAQHKLSSVEDLLILGAPEVAIIATDHASHAHLALKLLKAGSHVFLEKPISTTEVELLEIEEFLNKNNQSFFCVDFNRSFSPFFTLATKALEGRLTPCVVNYRVNALFLASDHWIYRSGGRIVGEACHMIELIIALVDSKLVGIKVSALKAIDKLSLDNFYATFEFSDGSIANLCYTSMGNSSLQKEKIEVFWEGRAMVIDDFKIITGFGTPFKIDQTSAQDKGHYAILHKFYDQIEYGQLTQNRAQYKRAIFASKLSFIINQLVLQGGGVYKCAP